MKRFFDIQNAFSKTFLIPVILLFLIAPSLFSLDLEITGGFGNLAFDKDRTSTLSAEEKEFSPQTFPLALVRFSGEQAAFAYNVGYEYDSILRNRLFGNFIVDLEYLSIEAGPFVSIFNTRQMPFNPGISAGLGLQIPGIFFVRAAGSSTLAFVNDEKTGYNSQNTGSLSAGFWVPYVICSLNLNVRNFAKREEEHFLIEDGLERWFFRADIFTKNVPFTIRLDFGYQSLERSYTSRFIKYDAIVTKTETDEFKSIFVGVEGRFNVNERLKIILGAEMPVYSWGERPMKDPPGDSLFFQAKAGMVLTFPARIN